LTPEEAAIERQYTSLIEGLRSELEEDRFERCFLAIAQGMAANPGINIESCLPDVFVARAFEVAVRLHGAARPVDIPEDEEPNDRSPLVMP
jgi:hypothetical protein